MKCPGPEELLALVAGTYSAMPPPIGLSNHVAQCEECEGRLDDFRRLVRGIGVHASGGPAASGSACLDEGVLAALIERRLDDADPATDAVQHLADCARCAGRLAESVRVAANRFVRKELVRIEAAGRRRSVGIRRHVAPAIGLVAAAALAGLLLWPDASPQSGVTDGPASSLRERTITTTVAPRLLEPNGVAGSTDSLRWTSTPHADRYQVLVFDREGTLVWDPQTADTVLALPSHLLAPGSMYAWKVEARTDWDRWVASEWEQFRTVEGQR